MQYVQLDVVRYAAAFLTAADGTGQTISCEVGPHDEPATYLIPDATRPGGGGGRDVEHRPAMVCREHLEEMLGHPPEEQPIFRRLQGPGPDQEARAEAALSKSRAGALETAESLHAINRGRGWEALGYATFADYVTGEFADRTPFPIPYEVISDEAGEPLPVFAMAEQIHAWGIAHAIGPLLREDETG
jgi:hypothetical protein